MESMQKKEPLAIPQQPQEHPVKDEAHKHSQGGISGPEKPPSALVEDLDLKPAPGALLLTGALMLVAGLAVGFLVGRGMGPRAEPAAETKGEKAADSSDLVKLSAKQSEAIKVDAAVMQSFRDERLTTGKIAFNDDNITPVFSPYTGRITRLISKPGDAVKKGDTLFEIDTPDLVQVESDIIAAVSALNKSRTALKLATRSESIAKHNIESSERNLELTRKNEDRQKALYEDKAAALKDWEAAQQAVQQAQKDLEGAQKDYEQSQSDIKSAESDIFSNETVLKAARDHLLVFGKTEAEIEKIEKERIIDRNTRVLAPIAGTVTQRKVGIGQYVQPASPDPLYVITDLSSMWMLADVYESDAALLKPGLTVDVSIMAFPEQKFSATIGYIGASVDPNTHRLAVRCLVENPDRKLKSEMFATFRISTDRETQSPAVPPSAVVLDGQTKVVWVAGQKENEFERRVVATGVEQHGLVQILSGIKAGERVASQGGLVLNSANAD